MSAWARESAWRSCSAITRSRADMEFLAREVASLRMAVGEVATRDFLRSELRSLLADLDERTGERPGERGQSHPGEGGPENAPT